MHHYELESLAEDFSELLADFNSGELLSVLRALAGRHRHAQGDARAVLGRLSAIAEAACRARGIDESVIYLHG